MKIGFIGVGNMGGSILRGYLGKEKEAGASIYVIDRDQDKISALRKEFGIVVCESIKELTRNSDVIFIGVKPDAFEEVLSEIATEITPEKIVVSMAAGISIHYITRFLGENTKIIRIMPNTPAFVGEGMTAVCRNDLIGNFQFGEVFRIFEAVGKACEVQEGQIHTVIGVSGSSPAYTYMYIDALAKAAEANGMERTQSILFAAQSVLGAAKMVLETGIDPEQLRINVCSPGGTTIEAVHKLQEKKFDQVVGEGFQAAVDKSKNMEKL